MEKLKKTCNIHMHMNLIFRHFLWEDVLKTHMGGKCFWAFVTQKHGHFKSFKGNVILKEINV